mmetsp:Transcript_4463/g.8888  ORF Transcript_4463/g.8888 Transcript_4463/m.8888 type:complete len:153 (+) Transcript_4463:48-506(+)
MGWNRRKEFLRQSFWALLLQEVYFWELALRMSTVQGQRFYVFFIYCSYSLHFHYQFVNVVRRMQRRTLENLNQIEVLNRALSDMPALDYSFELMLKEDGALTKDMFREKIYASEPESIRDSEIDFLFDLLDYSKDNLIDKEDFRPIAEHSSR